MRPNCSAVGKHGHNKYCIIIIKCKLTTVPQLKQSQQIIYCPFCCCHIVPPLNRLARDGWRTILFCFVSLYLYLSVSAGCVYMQCISLTTIECYNGFSLLPKIKSTYRRFHLYSHLMDTTQYFFVITETHTHAHLMTKMSLSLQWQMKICAFAITTPRHTLKKKSFYFRLRVYVCFVVDSNLSRVP